MVLHSEPSVNGRKRHYGLKNETSEYSWIPDECACMMRFTLKGSPSKGWKDANGGDEYIEVSSGDENERFTSQEVKFARK